MPQFQLTPRPLPPPTKNSLSQSTNATESSDYKVRAYAEQHNHPPQKLDPVLPELQLSTLILNIKRKRASLGVGRSLKLNPN